MGWRRALEAAVQADGSWSATLALSPGDNEIAFALSDALGNGPAVQMRHVFYDAAGAVVSVITPPFDGWVGAVPPTVTGAVSDAKLAGVTLTLNAALDGEASSYAPAVGADGTWAQSLEQVQGAGTVDLALVAHNAAGQPSPPLAWRFHVDLSPPGEPVVFSPSAGGWVNAAAVSVLGTVQEPESWPVHLDATVSNGQQSWNVQGEAGAAGTWSLPLSGLLDGPVALSLQAHNEAGAASSSTHSFSVDTQAPQVQVGAPPEGAWFAELPVTLAGTVTAASGAALAISHFERRYGLLTSPPLLPRDAPPSAFPFCAPQSCMYTLHAYEDAEQLEPVSCGLVTASETAGTRAAAPTVARIMLSNGAPVAGVEIAAGEQLDAFVAFQFGDGCLATPPISGVFAGGGPAYVLGEPGAGCSSSVPVYASDGVQCLLTPESVGCAALPQVLCAVLPGPCSSQLQVFGRRFAPVLTRVDLALFGSLVLAVSAEASGASASLASLTSPGGALIVLDASPPGKADPCP